MRTTLLVTSIPPPFNKDGIDVSKHQWTNLCINSWFKTGHDVVSINTDYEINQIKEFYPEVTFVTTEKSTKQLNNRPLIFISDALEKASYFKHQRYAICNADVLISTNLSDLDLDIDTCAYSNRIDIEEIESTTGKLFGGIDYFNLSNSFLNGLPRSYFSFGLPWWDYWLPYHAISKNIKLLKLVDQNKSPILFHKKHSDVWRPDDLCNMGKHFFDLMHHEINIYHSEGDFIVAYKKYPPASNIKAAFYALLARETCSHIHSNAIELTVA